MKKQFSLPARHFRLSLLTICFVLFWLFGKGGTAYAQEHHYRFELQSVTDPSAAKEVTDLIRSIFNTEAAPYQYYPTFDDVNNRFDFYSTVAVTQQQLEAQLSAQGLIVLSFADIVGTEPE